MSRRSLEETLPDWDDLNSVGNTAARAKFEANQIKDQISIYIAKCVKDAYTNQSLWVNNKPPTQSYIDNSVKIVGNTVEDAIHLKELSDAYREKWRIYEESKALLESMKDRISVFQTLSSNKRSGF